MLALQTQQATIDSREVAFMIKVRHSDLMRTINNFVQVLENAKLRSQDFFITHTYKTEGNNKTYDCYLLTKKGCDMVANKLTGERGILFTAAYVNRFEEMETVLKTQILPSYQITDPIERAKKWIEEQQQVQLLEQKVQKQQPKVLFADSVAASKTSILVGEMAKLLKQNGVDIGANRFFEWLRDNGYLIKRKGTDYNTPTQKAMDLELFEIKETVINHNDGHTSINKTSKITGKGQVYFINKFLKGETK